MIDNVLPTSGSDLAVSCSVAADTLAVRRAPVVLGRGPIGREVAARVDLKCSFIGLDRLFEVVPPVAADAVAVRIAEVVRDCGPTNREVAARVDLKGLFEALDRLFQVVRSVAADAGPI